MQARLTIILLALFFTAWSARGDCDRWLRTFRVPARVVQEQVFERKISVAELLNPPVLREERTDKVRLNFLLTNFWGEIFHSVVKPALTGRRLVKKYGLLELMRMGNQNHVVLGIDLNHLYLIIHLGRHNSILRIDGNPDSEVVLRYGRDAVIEGVYFDFPNLKTSDVLKIKAAARDPKVYQTCAEAACAILRAGGLSVGEPSQALPSTTRETLERIIDEGFFQGEQPIEMLAFKTSTAPLEKLINDSLILSDAHAELRKGSLEGYIIIARSVKKAVARWLLRANSQPDN